MTNSLFTCHGRISAGYFKLGIGMNQEWRFILVYGAMCTMNLRKPSHLPSEFISWGLCCDTVNSLWVSSWLSCPVPKQNKLACLCTGSTALSMATASLFPLVQSWNGDFLPQIVFWQPISPFPTIFPLIRTLGLTTSLLTFWTLDPRILNFQASECPLPGLALSAGLALPVLILVSQLSPPLCIK